VKVMADYRQAAKDVKEGKIAPVYLLYGTETFLMDEMCDWIKTQALQGGDAGFNLVVMDLEEQPVQSLVREAETPSFFGGKRVVIGKNAWFLTGTRVKAKVEHRPEELLDYAQNPLQDNVLILTVSAEKLDTRKKLVKQLKKTAVTVAFAPLETKELTEWVARRLKQFQVQVHPQAADRLVQLTGNDLRLLASECEKLAVYVGRGGTVTPDAVAELVPRTLEQDVFKLINSVAKRNTGEALGIFHDLLQHKEEPIRILALIIRQFRMMLQVKVMAEQGKAAKEIASLLRMHPYPVKLALQQGRSFSEGTLRCLLQRAIEADQWIKSGKIDKVLAVERLLLQADISSSTSG
jgi:DNA polymerase III subunit delta